MHSFDITRRFIRYYQDTGAKVLPGSSLLDPTVPMTFVMSAGLTQIESTVDESEKHAGERYVLLQTCFRHFDLDKVGKSPVHLSLFGMGGAFSFGPTDRRDTLGKIWDFLTVELGLPKEQLGAIYFAGGELEGHEFDKDVATVRAWKEIGLSPSQLLGVGIEDGFWKQGGGSGKSRFRQCGPTTELFFDRGLEWSCGSACQLGCRCGRFVEISNVLFIHSQFDQVTRSFKPLTTPFDETVIGVERVAMVLQEKSSVFEIECLALLIKLVQSFCPAEVSFDSVARAESQRLIVDHIRALAFLVADNAPSPGKGGRAGIMKKLVRTILTHQKVLGITDDEFIPDLVDTTLKLYRDQHSNLQRGREHLLDHFATEGKRFAKTLGKGKRQLDRFVQREGNGSISGQQALDLVKHYGFPLPLLEATLVQEGIKLNRREYWEAHEQWRRAVLETS
ncbi:MAG: hypothetical protein GY847_23835 [Proteobacteria bacterium]|nr:hypothetical protein [Pseudomonadota bacterium]